MAARAAAAHLRPAALSPRRRCEAAPRGRSSITTLISAAHGNPTRPLPPRRPRRSPGLRAPPRCTAPGNGSPARRGKGAAGRGCRRGSPPRGCAWGGAVGTRHRPRGGCPTATLSGPTARLVADSRAVLEASPPPRQTPGARRCFALGRGDVRPPVLRAAVPCPLSPASPLPQRSPARLRGSAGTGSAVVPPPSNPRAARDCPPPRSRPGQGVGALGGGLGLIGNGAGRAGLSLAPPQVGRETMKASLEIREQHSNCLYASVLLALRQTLGK